MNKIRITSDDIARSDAADSAQASPVESEISTAQPIVLSRRLIPWIIGICCVGILVVLSALVFLFIQVTAQDHGVPPSAVAATELSMTELIGALRQKINEDLKSSAEMKSFIETIHPLVEFTGAAVKSINVRTVDGTDRVGKDGSNISEVECVITFHWEGPVQKNGYTEILYVIDAQGRQLKTYRYLDSTATVNLDNIDWFKLGQQLAPLFF